MAKNTDQKTDKRLLNLKPPFKKGDPRPGAGRPKGSKDKIPRTFRAYAAEVCKDPNWQERIKALSMLGNPKTIEAILHYGEGKPAETVNLKHEDVLDLIK